MTAIEFVSGTPEVYPGWTAHGVTHLNGAIVHGRLDDYVGSVLARF
jgi:hypothetical protein